MMLFIWRSNQVMNTFCLRSPCPPPEVEPAGHCSRGLAVTRMSRFSATRCDALKDMLWHHALDSVNYTTPPPPCNLRTTLLVLLQRLSWCNWSFSLYGQDIWMWFGHRKKQITSGISVVGFFFKLREHSEVIVTAQQLDCWDLHSEILHIHLDVTWLKQRFRAHDLHLLPN